MCSEYVSGFLHELVGLGSLLDDSWFEASGAVADFAGCDLPEYRSAVGFELIGWDLSQSSEIHEVITYWQALTKLICRGFLS